MADRTEGANQHSSASRHDATKNVVGDHSPPAEGSSARPPTEVGTVEESRGHKTDPKLMESCHVEVFLSDTASAPEKPTLPTAAGRRSDLRLQGGLAFDDLDLEHLRLEGGASAAPLDEGFVSIATLTLDDLPECIRREEHLKTITEVAERVVCIRNNELSPERPPDFRFGGQRSLVGSGLLQMVSGDDILVVSTNRHVLYNDAEVRKASVDVCYDLPLQEAYKSGRIRRVGRGRGLGTIRANLDEDFTIALFRFKDFYRATAREEHSLQYFPRLMVRYDSAGSGVEGEGLEGGCPGPQVACVISHPLGCPKQVSFGSVLEEKEEGEKDPTSAASSSSSSTTTTSRRWFLHDAPTREGSSGAPILIFSPRQAPVLFNSVWYHVGSLQDASGAKLAHLQVNDPRLFHLNLERYLRREPRLPQQAVDAWARAWLCTDDGDEMELAVMFASHFPELDLEAPHVAVSLSLCLSAFLLRMDKFLPRLGATPWPCCPPLPREQLEERLKERGMDLERVPTILDTLAHDLIPPGLRHEPCEEGNFFIDWLMNRGPCHCRHILRTLAAQEGESSTTESSDPLAGFLFPDAFPVGLQRCQTWPFRNPSSSPEEGDDGRAREVKSGEGCLVLEVIKCVGIPPFHDPAFCMVLVQLELAEALLRYHSKPRDPLSPRPPLPLRLPQKPVTDIMAVTMYLMLAGLSHAASFSEMLNQRCREGLGAYSLIKSQLDPAASRPSNPAPDGGCSSTSPPRDAPEEESRDSNSSSGSDDEVATAIFDACALLRHVTLHSMHEHGDETESTAEERCGCDRPSIERLLSQRKAVAAHFLGQLPFESDPPPPPPKLRQEADHVEEKTPPPHQDDPSQGAGDDDNSAASADSSGGREEDRQVSGQQREGGGKTDEGEGNEISSSSYCSEDKTYSVDDVSSPCDVDKARSLDDVSSPCDVDKTRSLDDVSSPCDVDTFVHEYRMRKTSKNRLAMVTHDFLTPSWVCADVSHLLCFEDMAGWNVGAAMQRLKQDRTVDLESPKALEVKAVLRERVAPGFPATVQAIHRFLASREVLLHNSRRFLDFCRREAGIELPGASEERPGLPAQGAVE